MDSRFAAAAAAFDAQREEDGVRLLTKALDAAPGPRWAYLTLGHRRFNARAYGDAEHWARAGLAAGLEDLDLWTLLGVSLRRQGRFEEALAALDKAHAIDPRDPKPLLNQANILGDMRDGRRLLAVGEALVSLHPDRAEHHRLVSIAYRLLDRFQDAQASLDTALQLQPQLVDAWIDRASVASAQLRDDEAVATIRRGLAVIPDDRRLNEALVVLLRRTGRRGEAEALLRDLLAQDPDQAWAHFQLGATFVDDNLLQAHLHLRRAVALAPQDKLYWLFLADCLERSRSGDEGSLLEEAYATLNRSMALGPVPPGSLNVAQKIAVRIGDYALLSKLGSFKDYGRGMARLGLQGHLMGQLSRVETAEDRLELVAQHRLWGEGLEAFVAQNPIARPAPRPKDGRIRVGFMSSDLRRHPVAYFAQPLFEHIDRSRFEVYAYSFSLGQEDDIQRRIAAQATAFCWNRNISSRAAAQMIADDRLDILFELGGSTHMNKLDVMAYRPAPLQASWLGYPHSAGLEAIDFLLVDPYLKPPNPALLIERPMVMPRSWICLGRESFRDDQVIEPVIPETRNGAITFGTANNPHKYGPHMLRTWAKVVARVPGSRFLFVRPEGGAPSFRQNMTKLFAEEGVAAERVQFEAVRGEHLPFYNEIDIALDTFPLTGGATTCETLWMGVPVVSLVGEALFERLSYSILTNAGLGDLVATTPDDYVDIAVALAADTARRQSLRTGLRGQIKASPLGRPEQFARDFYDLVAATVAAA